MVFYPTVRYHVPIVHGPSRVQARGFMRSVVARVGRLYATSGVRVRVGSLLRALFHQGEYVFVRGGFKTYGPRPVSTLLSVSRRGRVVPTFQLRKGHARSLFLCLITILVLVGRSFYGVSTRFFYNVP